MAKKMKNINTIKDLNHDEDIIMLDDVGHFPFFESPDDINSVLLLISSII